MKTKTSNTTVNYESQSVNPQTTVEFTKIVNDNNITVHGKIIKNGKEVGSIAYKEVDDYLIISYKPFSALTAEEVASISALAPKCVAEAIA